MSETAPSDERRRPLGTSSSRVKGPSKLPPELWLTARRRLNARLERALETSIADETELVWIEARRSRLGLRADADTYTRRQRTVQIRVREHERSGAYRTGATELSDIATAIRLASASSAANPRARVPPLPGEQEPLPLPVEAFDRRLARITEQGAESLLSTHAADDEAAILEWTEGQVAIRNSLGLVRYQRATAVSLQVRSGLGTGAGFATHAARSLLRLDPRSVFERARRRRTFDPPGELQGEGLPLLLSSEATAELVDLLNHRAFATSAFRRGGSFLREHLGVQVFDRRLDLRDDGTDPAGLPFPFDLEGRSKRPVALIRGGVPKTPTVSTRSAAEFGVLPTAHCVGGDDAFALHLFLEAGEHEDEELLALADGGLWISRLESVECFDPERVLLRSVARGVRRIENGRLTRPLPDLLWEDSLLRIFSNFLGIGRDTRCRLSSDGLLGGISVPPVVIGEASSLRPRS